MTRERATGQGYHDLGGLDEGPVLRTEHSLEPWEKRVDVLRALLMDKKRRVLRADGLRGATERLGEPLYRSHSYYERWMAAIMAILQDRGILERSEIERRIDDIAARLGVDVPDPPAGAFRAAGDGRSEEADTR